MYIGIAIIGAFILMIMFGLVRNLLRRWEIKEEFAMLLSLLILGGVLLSPINIGGRVIMSVGGFIIPFIFCIWLLSRASRKEVLRTLGGAFVIGIISALLVFYFPLDNDITVVDASVFIGIIAAGIAFLVGRSRRGAFVSAALGVMLTNVFQLIIYAYRGYVFSVVLGVGSIFSATVIAAIVAAFVAEVAGESREYARKKETDVEFMNIDRFVNNSKRY